MIKIIGIAKSDTHSVYVLGKKQEFFKAFRNLLADFQTEEGTLLDRELFGRQVDSHGEPDESKEEDIESVRDQHHFFQNAEDKIDVIFGNDRVFLIFNTSKDKQDEISRMVQKFFSL